MDCRAAGQGKTMTSRKSIKNIALVTVLTMLLPVMVQAAPRVQRPQLKGDLQARRTQIVRGRNQRIKPQQRQALVARLSAMKVTSAKFKHEIAAAPLKVRYEVFKQMAATQGTKPASFGTRLGNFYKRAVGRKVETLAPAESASFDRRLRGMLKQDGKNRVAKSHKTFFEVTPDNFKLFQQVMGGNVVWFAVNSSPGHLHTLIADQGGRGKFHHNVYGEGNSNTNAASITGNFTQYAMPVVLTDKQMDRFTRYLNKGIKHHNHNDSNHSVYGFYARGNKVTDIKCTNWVTAAPVGNLPRWARTLDKRLIKMGADGQLKKAPSAVAKQGLHAALAAAGNATARGKIVAKVLQNPMSKWNRSAVRRMARTFDKVTTDFPNRPADMVMRDALAKTLGLGRSKDPAKWSYDLLMSKQVPVVAVLNSSRNAEFANMSFNMEIMGQVGPNGKVQPSGSSHFGSDAPQNAGSLGVVPANRQPRTASAQ